MPIIGDPPVDEVEVRSETPSTQAPPRPESPVAGTGPPNRRRWWLWAAVLAILVGAAALVLVLSGDDDSTAPRGQAGTAPSGMPMMGGSGSAQAAIRTVEVELGEMYVRPSVTTVPAGEVKFVARNVGKVEHELMIERMPITMDGPGKPAEDAAMGMIEDMAPMHRGQMALRLKPGKYELFCNVPGHYAAGQRTTFTVTE